MRQRAAFRQHFSSATKKDPSAAVMPPPSDSAARTEAPAERCTAGDVRHLPFHDVPAGNERPEMRAPPDHERDAGIR